MIRMTFRTAAIASLTCVAAIGSSPLSAEIAILTDGRMMKISGYESKGPLMELTLPSGGKVALPVERIERIVDDEVAPPPAVAAVVAAAPATTKRNWKYDETRNPIFKSKFNDVIVAAAKKFDVDAALISAVIKAESDYNPKTVSHKGAQGLMQLMPATARRFGVVDSFDPVQNIHAGTRYLRWLLNSFNGDVELAVAAYNAGEGNVWKYKGVPPFRETMHYVKKIARHLGLHS